MNSKKYGSYAFICSLVTIFLMIISPFIFKLDLLNLIGMWLIMLVSLATFVLAIISIVRYIRFDEERETFALVFSILAIIFSFIPFFLSAIFLWVIYF